MAYYKNYRNYPTYQKKEKTYKSYLHLNYKEICDREKYFLDRIKALHSLWNEFIDYFAEHNDKVEKATDYLIEKIKKHLKLKKFNKDIKFALQRIKELEFLNSAGVIALAKLIILSRQLDKEIQVIINSHIPWQQLTLSPLTKLWEKLTISAEN